jgi:hypothetical protein
VEFREHLLPQLRFHGWYPGAYLGHPLMLYYFPLPFRPDGALQPLLGCPWPSSWGRLAGVLLLPPLVYAAFRSWGSPSPVRWVAAAAATVFLFLEENPIWGGTLASMLTGESPTPTVLRWASCSWGRATARTRAATGRGGPPRAGLDRAGPRYAVLWAGASASYFLYGARAPARTLAWLAGVAALAFALAAFWLLPLLADWGWTTRYDDPGSASRRATCCRPTCCPGPRRGSASPGR